jgi:hypothetical protein
MRPNAKVANMKYSLGDEVEYNTRFRQWTGAWVPGKVTKIEQELDNGRVWVTLEVLLYNDKMVRLVEAEQKLCLRHKGSHWNKDKREWVK